MRYHKAIEVTEEQANAIKCGRAVSLSSVVVVAQGDRYYDVRGMTDTEIDAFVGDLARAEYTALKAASSLPH